MNERLAWLSWSALVGAVVVVLQAAVAALHHLDRSEWALAIIREDGVFEALGAIAALLAGVTFAYLAWSAPRFEQPELRIPRWPAIGLAVLMLLMFAEEVSWGQRVLNFATPGWIADRNTQLEFNLHNLRFFHPVLDFNWLKFAWGAGAVGYLGLLPLLAAMWPRLAQRLRKAGVPVASPFVAVCMLFAFGMWMRGTGRAQASGDYFAGHEVGETFEATIEVLFLALALETFARWQSANPEISYRGWLRISGLALAAGLAVSGFGLWAGSGLNDEMRAAVAMRRGRYLLERQQWAQASEQFAVAAAAAPGLVMTHFYWGIALLQAERWDEAATQFERVVEIDPKLPEAHNNLGHARLKQGRTAEAIEHFRAAVQLRPGDAHFQRNLAQATAGS